MKKLFITGLLMLSMGAFSQTYNLDKKKDTTEVLNGETALYNGKVYFVYKSKNNKLYIKVTSKTNKIYKKYLK
jgi:uncharacterized FlaG/YvyC family protein